MESHKSVGDLGEKFESIELVDKGAKCERQINENFDVVDANVMSKRLSMKVTEIPLKVYSVVCVKLNIEQTVRFNDFRMLAEKVGVTREETDVIKQRYENCTDQILKIWALKKEATVGKLIDLLKEDDFGRDDVVQPLQDWVNQR